MFLRSPTCLQSGGPGSVRRDGCSYTGPEVHGIVADPAYRLQISFLGPRRSYRLDHDT